MQIARNSPCPCGSGMKYKRCCGATVTSSGNQDPSSSKFRFEAGSYGGPGRGYMPSALCYQQTTSGQWQEHFCLVNPTQSFELEDEAISLAESDLNEAFSVKAKGGSDHDLAEALKTKGYIKVDDFQRAID